jgi:hypothetical protein
LKTRWAAIPLPPPPPHKATIKTLRRFPYGTFTPFGERIEPGFKAYTEISMQDALFISLTLAAFALLALLVRGCRQI